MAFVNEKITREENINLFNSFHLKDPITKVIANPEYWTVDRERGLYFVLYGGYNSDDIPLFFALIINNQKVYIEVHLRGKGSRQRGKDSYWKISKILISEKLELDKDNIILYIKEAAEAYTKGPLNDAYIKSLKIEIISEPIFVN